MTWPQHAGPRAVLSDLYGTIVEKGDGSTTSGLSRLLDVLEQVRVFADD